MNVFDRRYFIIDSSGNYYAVNGEGALTVVKDISDAKMFDILEANRKISSSGMSKSLRTVVADKKMMKKKENADVPETEAEFVMTDMDFEYIARRLHSLFVQGVKRNPEAECGKMRENITETEDYNMDYVRQETMFDGRDNDWLSMISRKADFFENVWQYVTNLRIDLDDIEDELEALMEECEDANCNVTQGYKMFKRIKELRIIRKAKKEELRKICMIAECFDCRAMADTYIYLEEQLGNANDNRIIQLEMAAEQEEVKVAI